MANTSSGLRRSIVRWTFQVSASFAATLIAALIVQALPRADPEAAAPSPEMTSGGKFAARAVAVRAYDGLDTMPLPRVDALPVASPFVVPAAFLAAPPADLAGFGSVSPPAADGPAAREHAKSARLARTSARAGARRALSPSDAPSPSTTGVQDATQPETAAAEPADDGLLQRVVSGTRQAWSSTSATTRGAWSATASAGSSLVSRLVPQ